MGLNNDDIRELAIDVILRKKYTVEELSTKILNISKDKMKEAYISGYNNGQKDTLIDMERYGDRFPDKNIHL